MMRTLSIGALLAICLLLAVVVALLAPAEARWAAPAGSAEGRQGNARLADEDPEAAAARYEAGLDRAGSPAGGVAAALLNNLGLAHLALGDASRARAELERSLAAAPTAGDRARAAYNAGIAAAAERDMDAAAELFRRALLADPAHEDARYNFEIVRRATEEPPDEADQAPPPEPTPFARQLKERADELVAERRYLEALDLMRTGLDRDSTVAAYNDFTDRLAAVVEVDAEGQDDASRE